MSALETLAGKAHAVSERLAGQGGIKRKLAGELANDSVFLRKVKPALINHRLWRGAPSARSGSQLGDRPKATGIAPSPVVVIGAALVLGVVAAKLIDWRRHAYPRG